MDILDSILSRPVKKITIPSTKKTISPQQKQWKPPPFQSSKTFTIQSKIAKEKEESKNRVNEKREEEKKKNELRAKLIAANRSGASGDIIWKSIEEDRKIRSLKAIAATNTQQNGEIKEAFLNNGAKRGKFKIPAGKHFGAAVATNSKALVDNNKSTTKTNKQEEPKRRYICGVPQPIKRNAEEIVTRNKDINVNDRGQNSAHTQHHPLAQQNSAHSYANREYDDDKTNKLYSMNCRIKNDDSNHNVKNNHLDLRSKYIDWDKPNQEDLDFIDDDPVEDYSWRDELRKITGYDPRRYGGENEECDVSGFDRSNMEGKYSKIIAEKEDAEQLKLIQIEEKREQMAKRLKRKR